MPIPPVNRNSIKIVAALLLATTILWPPAFANDTPQFFPSSTIEFHIAKPSFDECVSGNCVNGKGKIVYTNGNSYEGDFASGKKEGQGTFTFSDGSVYFGQFANDIRKGKGKLLLASGEIYEGDWVNDKQEGNGTSIYTNGAVYVGHFANGLRGGKGKFIYTSGNVYEGDFVNDKQEGIGTYTFKSGGVYVGQFANDVYNGKGKFTFPNGNIYDGDFVNGYQTGKGKIVYADGNIYVGDFVGGKRTGKGKTTIPNGDVYEGEFVDGKYEGQGTYTSKNGNYYTGGWKNSKQNGYGKEFNKAANSTKEGTWKDGLLLGATAPKPVSQPSGKFAVGEVVDLQSDYVNTYWHKAEIVEIVGDKYKVRKLKNNYNNSTENVSEQKIRPATPPIKYEVGQKVEAMDSGVWYKVEIISIEGNSYYGIRFESTSNRSNRYDQTEEFMRPLISSTANPEKTP